MKNLINSVLSMLVALALICGTAVVLPDPDQPLPENPPVVEVTPDEEGGDDGDDTLAPNCDLDDDEGKIPIKD